MTDVRCKFKDCKYEQTFEGYTFKEAVEWMRDYTYNNHQKMKCCHELERVEPKDNTLNLGGRGNQ